MDRSPEESSLSYRRTACRCRPSHYSAATRSERRCNPSPGCARTRRSAHSRPRGGGTSTGSRRPRLSAGTTQPSIHVSLLLPLLLHCDQASALERVARLRVVYQTHVGVLVAAGRATHHGAG